MEAQQDFVTITGERFYTIYGFCNGDRFLPFTRVGKTRAQNQRHHSYCMYLLGFSISVTSLHTDGTIATIIPGGANLIL